MGAARTRFRTVLLVAASLASILPIATRASAQTAPTSTPAPAAPAPEAGVVVHFTASEPGVQLLRATGLSEGQVVGRWPGAGRLTFVSRHYAVVCGAPCDPELPAGAYDFVVGAHDQLFTVAPVEVRKATTIHADYVSRQGIRVAGVILAVTGALVGGVLMISAAQAPPCSTAGYCGEDLDRGRFFSGLAVAGIGSAVGILMALTRDSVEIGVSER